MDTLLTGSLLYVTVAWGIITGVLIALWFYRSILSSKEEGKDQLFLAGAEAKMADEVHDVAARLLRLSKPIIALSVLSAVLLLVIGVMWVQARLNAPY
jgi:hypothetical protein